MPYYKFEGHRKTLLTWGSQLEKNDTKFEAESDQHAPGDPSAVAEKGMKNWWRKENTASIDALPALRSAPFRKDKLENYVPSVKEGAFRAKEVKVADLDGLDVEEVRWEVRQWLMGADNLKLLLGILIGYCLAFLSLHGGEERLALLVRHVLP